MTGKSQAKYKCKL